VESDRVPAIKRIKAIDFDKKSVTLEDLMHACNVCGYKWYPRKMEPPKRCARDTCRSVRWATATGKGER